MLTVDVTFEEWSDFVDLSNEQMTSRRDGWVGVLTVNSRGHEWSFTRWGNTPLNERRRLGIGFLEKLEQEYLAHVDRSGGRMFVKKKGAFYKMRDGKAVPFAVFRFARAHNGPAPEDEGSPVDDGFPAR
jgi:hypothetical protein